VKKTFAAAFITFMIAPALLAQSMPTPDLVIGVSGVTPPRADPGGSYRYVLFFGNTGSAAAHDVQIAGNLAVGETFVGGQSLHHLLTCAAGETSGTFRCTTALLNAREPDDLLIDVILPKTRTGGSVTSAFAISSSDSTVTRSTTATIELYRQLVVTNVEDDGFGSLRQAIRDGNSDTCTNDACKIVFEIPQFGQAAVFTIQPRTPLPEITGKNVIIDARTQTAFGGDSNSNGPEVELNGALQKAGNGLVMRQSGESGVYGLAINGFLGGAGVGVIGASPTIAENYIGADATGAQAKPNNQGIGVLSGMLAITGNVIAGNRRSGIYIYGGGATIKGNKIGTAADGVTPLGNGASGVFVRDTAGYTSIDSNTISFNHGFGVALGAHSIETSLTKNSIRSNELLGIDIGLDNATPNSPDDHLRYPNTPVLNTARYDSVTDTTVITGHLDSRVVPGYNLYRIEFFASDEADQGETYLGTFTLAAGSPAHDDVVFSAKGDLTGKWITATNTRAHILAVLAQVPQPPPFVDGLFSATSEFSNAVQVTR
jgi:hypothetical protein